MDNKRLKESSNIIRNAIQSGLIKKPYPKTDSFFFDKSLQSIKIASKLLELDKEELQTSMWVINTSYYSMFFGATALLAKYGHKIISKQGIHKLTYHAIVHFFVNEDNKLEKHFIEEYKKAVEDAEQLMQISEKNVDIFLSEYSYEINKRKDFTYDFGKIAEKKKAKTSFQRARNFINIIKDILDK
jgi:uncharacterized protein (UPF0332 family)